MDTIETPKTDETSFGKGLAKTFAKTTVESAGVYTGLFVFLFAVGKTIKFKNDRFDKKHRIESN